MRKRVEVAESADLPSLNARIRAVRAELDQIIRSLDATCSARMGLKRALDALDGAARILMSDSPGCAHLAQAKAKQGASMKPLEELPGAESNKTRVRRKKHEPN